MLSWLIGNILPLALILPFCVALELAFPQSRYNLKSRFPGALWLIAMPGIAWFAAFPFRRLWEIAGASPVLSLSTWPFAAQLVTMMVAIDFLRYWEHRLEHWLLWPMHAVHHSPRDLHAANAYSHPLNGIPEFIILWAPLTLVAVDGRAFLLASLMSAFQSLIIHSPLRVHGGSLRRVLVDHRYHRIHHSRDPRHFEKNFGILLTIWDQLFRTAYFPKADEWPQVGIEREPPDSYAAYLSRPFR